MKELASRKTYKQPVFGKTSVMQDVVRSAQRIAPSKATVLISGATGTGKEVMARFIHQHSPRAAMPFVPMNCAAIPETLLESELFGHVRGAFTGAAGYRKGRLAMANEGTLFLDEVGELPLALQVKFLRVLQERMYEPVGGNESVLADFRLITATNRNLDLEVAAGNFRRDLYYRLMVCPLELPTLQERAEDIGELFLHFWRERGETRSVEAGVLDVLSAYAWPGNIRELENLVERVSVLAEGPVVRVEDIPSPVRPSTQARNWPTPAPMDGAGLARAFPSTLFRVQPSIPAAWNAASLTSPPSPASEVAKDEVAVPLQEVPPAHAGPEPGPETTHVFPVNLPELLRKLEDEYIDAALDKSKGNKKLAADLLCLQRTTLVEKLRRRTQQSTALAASA